MTSRLFPGGLLAVVLLASSCSSTASSGAPLLTRTGTVFDLHVGLTKKEVHHRLESIGSLLREEAHRQEVWRLSDPRFEGAIAGYDGEERLRFITFVARRDGEPVRFAEALDLSSAEHQVSGSVQTYRYRPSRSRYIVVARGTNPEFLSYLTIRSSETAEREEEERENE